MRYEDENPPTRLADEQSPIPTVLKVYKERKILIQDVIVNLFLIAFKGT